MFRLLVGCGAVKLELPFEGVGESGKQAQKGMCDTLTNKDDVLSNVHITACDSVRSTNECVREFGVGGSRIVLSWRLERVCGN